jgi:hypothetical protein
MAKDIFNVETTIGGSWQLDGAVINLEGAEELVVTAATVQYSRGTTKFSPLNQRKRYILTGEANGRITMGLIIGPSKDIKTFLQRYADTCQVKKNVLSLSPAGLQQCEGENVPIEFICNGVLIDDLTVNVQQVGQNLTMVGAGLGMSFVSLQVK